MAKLTKLNSSDLEFTMLTRANNDGEQPSLTFRVKNAESVAKFLKETDELGLIWTTAFKDTLERDTLRLSYAYNEDNSEITFARVVTRNTFAHAANQTLANSVLTCIFDAELGDFADIYTGLTNRDHTEYTPSVVAKKIYDDNYDATSATRPAFLL